MTLTKCPNCLRNYHKLRYIETTYVMPDEDIVTETYHCLHCHKVIAVNFKQIRVLTSIQVIK